MHVRRMHFSIRTGLDGAHDVQGGGRADEDSLGLQHVVRHVDRLLVAVLGLFVYAEWWVMYVHVAAAVASKMEWKGEGEDKWVVVRT